MKATSRIARRGHQEAFDLLARGNGGIICMIWGL